MHDSLPDNLRGRRVQITSGKNPKTIRCAGFLPAAASSRPAPRGARPRARGSVVVQVDGLPARPTRSPAIHAAVR